MIDSNKRPAPGYLIGTQLATTFSSSEEAKGSVTAIEPEPNQEITRSFICLFLMFSRFNRGKWTILQFAG